MIKHFQILLIVCVISCSYNNVYSQQTQEPSKTNVPENTKWRITARGGYGNRVANFDDAKETIVQNGFDKKSTDKYVKSLKQGYDIGGRVHYMFWEKTGLGLDYSFFNSSGEISGYVQSYDAFGLNNIFLKISDDIFTSYVGASVMSESRIGKSNFYATFQTSIGYLSYRDEVLTNYYPTLISGSSIGIRFEGGIEYFVLPNMSVGTSVGYFNSTLTKIKIDDGTNSQEIKLEDEQKESLARLNLFLNLSLYF